MLMSQSLIKTTSIILLTIPFILILTYNPIKSQFSLQQIISPFTKWSTFTNIVNDLNDKITKQIEQLKLVVEKQEEVNACLKYVRIIDSNNNTVQDENIRKYEQLKIKISEEQQNGFCSGVELQQQQLYIHVLDYYANIDNIKQKLTQLQNKFHKQLHSPNIIIKYQKLDPSTVPQHIKDKLTQQLYIKTLSQQFSNLHYTNHCRYTHKKCKNYLIYLINWQSLQQNYIQYNNIIYTKQNNCLNTIMELISYNLSNIKYLNRIIKIQRLYNIQKQLMKMEQFMSGYMVTVNLEYLSKYAIQVDKFIQDGRNSVGELIGVQDAFIIDIYATQYRIGVLLPLILILIVFPCSNVIKV